MASCSISAFDAAGAGALRTIVNVGELGPGEVARPRDERYPLAGFPKVAAVLRQQRGYVVAVDDRDADRASVALLEALGKHSQVGVPLLRDGEVWGELWCASSTRLTAADLPHFYRVAAEVSALVAAARRDGLLLAPERVDALTGLADEVALREHLRALAGADGPPRRRSSWASSSATPAPAAPSSRASPTSCASSPTRRPATSWPASGRRGPRSCCPPATSRPAPPWRRRPRPAWPSATRRRACGSASRPLRTWPVTTRRSSTRPRTPPPTPVGGRR